MSVTTTRDFNRILVKSESFYGGVDFPYLISSKLKPYFINQRFKIIEINEKRLVASKGNLFTNLFAFSMSKLKRSIVIEIDESEQVTITSIVDTTGQSIRKSEMDVFTLEVEDIIDCIQNKDSVNASLKQNRKSTIGNYLILFSLIGIVAAATYVVVRSIM